MPPCIPPAGNSRCLVTRVLPTASNSLSFNSGIATSNVLTTTTCTALTTSVTTTTNAINTSTVPTVTSPTSRQTQIFTPATTNIFPATSMVNSTAAVTTANASTTTTSNSAVNTSSTKKPTHTHTPTPTFTGNIHSRLSTSYETATTPKTNTISTDSTSLNSAHAPVTTMKNTTFNDCAPTKKGLSASNIAIATSVALSKSLDTNPTTTAPTTASDTIIIPNHTTTLRSKQPIYAVGKPSMATTGSPLEMMGMASHLDSATVAAACTLIKGLGPGTTSTNSSSGVTVSNSSTPGATLPVPRQQSVAAARRPVVREPPKKLRRKVNPMKTTQQGSKLKAVDISGTETAEDSDFKKPKAALRKAKRDLAKEQTRQDKQKALLQQQQQQFTLTSEQGMLMYRHDQLLNMQLYLQQQQQQHLQQYQQPEYLQQYYKWQGIGMASPVAPQAQTQVPIQAMMAPGDANGMHMQSMMIPGGHPQSIVANGMKYHLVGPLSPQGPQQNFINSQGQLVNSQGQSILVSGPGEWYQAHPSTMVTDNTNNKINNPIGFPPTSNMHMASAAMTAGRGVKATKKRGSHKTVRPSIRNRKCWLCVVFGNTEEEKSRIQMKWQHKLDKLVWADGHLDNFCPSVNGRATAEQAALAKKTWSQARSKRSPFRKYLENQ